VRYDLTGVADRELPLILALMPVLPKHATDVEHFQDATLAPPVGSGPYIIADVRPARGCCYGAIQITGQGRPEPARLL